MTPVPFAHQIAMAEPAVEPLLVALADAFSPVDDAAVHDHVGRLAERLRHVAPDPAAQLAALGSRVVAGFRRPNRRVLAGDLDDLLLPTVLQGRRGDELLVAAAAVAAAHRLGWDVGVLCAEDRVFVGHDGLEEPLVVSPRDRGRLLDVRDVTGADVFWVEPHGLADRVLERVAERARDLGLHHVALRAAELALALPVEPREHLVRAVALARVRARFN
ncbi:transglutaminase family protein [Conexibacter sp. SYSU D00693]|uniref:transglutaminase family protein n=1 Tax=Conexibacter sp. SYSU D00693 TaxID=2812560 RepID=UPI00196A225C|nr:transglutaminase family protein [Conexibacter sp. SYSU D00693]